jgi:hypothetical protein
MRDISVCDEVARERAPVASATHPAPWTFLKEARVREIVAVVEMWCCWCHSEKGDERVIPHWKGRELFPGKKGKAHHLASY